MAKAVKDTEISARAVFGEKTPDNVQVRVKDGDDSFALLCTRKTFSSGSCGFQGSMKVPVAGQMYQANVILTLIGSKPKAD